MASVSIISRDNHGRMKHDTSLGKAMGAMDWIVDAGGWDWFILAACKFCLSMAQQESGTRDRADKWIERYKALREVR